MSITSRNFGKTKNGEPIKIFRIENANGMIAEVTDFGAILTSLFVPDRNGKVTDIVLGFDSAKEYFYNPSFFGSTIGRNANRIANASFELNGAVYKLEKNDKKNNLHSHFDECFNKKLFKAETINAENAVKFSIESPDLDQGFPGKLDASVTYRLTEENGLEIEYYAVSDRDTVYNPTNHSYFNLNGHASGSAMGHKLWLKASGYTPVVKGCIPTGEIAPVAGTVFDFTKKTTIGDRINNDDEQLILGKGYDHNFAVDIKGRRLTKIATLSNEDESRTMTVYSDLPGVQFYAGNCIKPQTGKGGAKYGKRCAVCLETQFFPNAINEKKFASPVLKAGKEFHSITKYVFD